jgi:excisionase family DNA binding protein
MTSFNPADFTKGYQGYPAPQLVIHVHRGKRKKPRVAESAVMLTAQQAAERLGVSAKLVYKLFHRRELEGVKIAGAVRIHRASVENYLSSHSNKKPAAPTVAEPAPIPAARPKRRRRSSRSEGFRFLPPKG